MVCCCTNVFIHTNTLMIAKKLMKHYYLGKKFYSSLNKGNITDADYKHAKRVWEDFIRKILCESHDWYIQSNTLLMATIFENFRNKWTEI